MSHFKKKTVSTVCTVYIIFIIKKVQLKYYKIISYNNNIAIKLVYNYYFYIVIVYIPLVPFTKPLSLSFEYVYSTPLSLSTIQFPDCFPTGLRHCKLFRTTKDRNEPEALLIIGVGHGSTHGLSSLPNTWSSRRTTNNSAKRWEDEDPSQSCDVLSETNFAKGLRHLSEICGGGGGIIRIGQEAIFLFEMSTETADAYD